MNSITKLIMKLLNVDLNTALQLQTSLDETGIDYSECTQKELEREIKAVAAEHQEMVVRGEVKK